MKAMKRKWVILLITFSVILGTILSTVPALAATTATVTVTNTPQYIAITIAPTTFTMNSLTGNSHVLVNTTYYTNPLGDTTAPSATVVDGECDFTITNTANVAIDLTGNMTDMSGGSDNSTNSGTGTAGATSYGAYAYYSGETFSAKVALKASASILGNFKSNLGATTNLKVGFMLAEQTNAWSGSSAATMTLTITATAH